MNVVRGLVTLFAFPAGGPRPGFLNPDIKVSPFRLPRPVGFHCCAEQDRQFADSPGDFAINVNVMGAQIVVQNYNSGVQFVGRNRLCLSGLQKGIHGDGVRF